MIDAPAGGAALQWDGLRYYLDKGLVPHRGYTSIMRNVVMKSIPQINCRSPDSGWIMWRENSHGTEIDAVAVCAFRKKLPRDDSHDHGIHFIPHQYGYRFFSWDMTLPMQKRRRLSLEVVEGIRGCVMHMMARNAMEAS